MNLELALVELYLSGHICPLSMLRVKAEHFSGEIKA